MWSKLQVRENQNRVGPALLLIVDSHIQRVLLASGETTVTQQVSHRPIKCQDRLWSQRYEDQRVNHGDNLLLRPLGRINAGGIE